MTIKRIFLRILCAILLLSPAISQAKSCPNNQEEIQQVVDANRVKHNMPGVQVSILCSTGEALHFNSGTTTIDGDIPIETRTLFQVGSQTKTVIASVILQLEQEHLLTIDEPIGTYIDNIPEEWKAITIKQILNHTSGIYNYTDVLIEQIKTDENADLQKHWYTYDLIDLVRSKPLYFPPGSGWHYSNTNYVLAGLIIEKVTKQSLNVELQERVNDHTQLSHIYYLPLKYSESFKRRMAHGYSIVGLFPDEPYDTLDTNNSWANAAGALVANTEDMSLWFQHLMHGDILPAEKMDEMKVTVPGQLPGTGPIGYGLGIAHSLDTFGGQEAWWHSGGTLGFSSIMLWLVEKDIVISVHVNHVTANRDVYELTKELVNVV